MPINLGNVQTISKEIAKATKKEVLHPPKNHSKLLTGTGGKIGILSEARNPMNNKDQHIAIELYYRKSHQNVKGLEKNIIPVSLITPNTPLQKRKLPESAVDIGSGADAGKLFIHMMPHDFELLSKSDNNAFGKRVYINYELSFYYIGGSSDMADPLNHAAINKLNTIDPNDNRYYVDYMANVADIDRLKSHIPSRKTNGDAVEFDENKLKDYIENYSVYDGTCEALDFTYDSVLDYATDVIKDTNSTDITLREFLVNMEFYDFSIDTYVELFKIMEQYLPQDIIDAVKECNTNLMTVAALQALKDQKQNLTRIKKQPINPNVASKYSSLQKAAIEDNESLVLVQSGAGTGKSTVVLGRIDHMIDTGVKKEDIIVLSFTNAAKDHILDLYPGIHSMTIASMIHTIYIANFPTQVLSSESTLLNMLIANEPRSDVRDGLCKFLRKGDRMGIHEFTAFYNYVNANYDAVIQMLDRIGQTTLLLESLICGINMHNIKIPKNMTCKHMIVDEVQDNSMFEFIYMLKYTAYNHNSLFMVGDCSQTLYEFRMANPGTLNTLEASGIFSTHVLDINYRSTQAILDFANVVLSDIKANRYANIKLRSNNLTKVDYNVFTSTVQCSYRQLKRKSDLNDALPGIFAEPELKAFIKAALLHKEKLAILSYSRATAARCKEVMDVQYPNSSCVSACTRVTYDITILSSYVARNWKNVQYFNDATMLQDICNDMINMYSSPNPTNPQEVRNRDVIQKLAQTTYKLANAWYNMYVNKQITRDQYIEKFKEALIDFEIKNNTYRRRITSAVNKREKESDDLSNADIIVSTIHSVKGLEYDKVIVIYDDDALDEASKRLYYVALTRAMKGEYVLGYGTKKYSNIMEWYTTIKNKLDPNFVSQNVTVEVS